MLDVEGMRTSAVTGERRANKKVGEKKSIFEKVENFASFGRLE